MLAHILFLNICSKSEKSTHNCGSQTLSAAFLANLSANLFSLIPQYDGIHMKITWLLSQLYAINIDNFCLISITYMLVLTSIFQLLRHIIALSESEQIR